MKAQREAQLDQAIALNSEEIGKMLKRMKRCKPEMKVQLESYVLRLKQENAQLRNEMSQIRNSYNR